MMISLQRRCTIDVKFFTKDLLFLNLIGLFLYGHVNSALDPNRLFAGTSIDITATPGSSTPCGDKLFLNVQDPNTGMINQYPASQMGSCLNPVWHVPINSGMNPNILYKCWPSRGTDNSQSVAMLSNGQIAYNKCSAENFQRPQSLKVGSWSDIQDNGSASTGSPNVFMLYSAYPLSHCPGLTFAVWIRLPANYNNQKRCATIVMYDANCYFDKSRCAQGYEYNIDDQLNALESNNPDKCSIAFLFGSPEGQSNTVCSSTNYIQSTRDVLNQQVGSLPVQADPMQNMLFGIGHGGARVFQALPLMSYWALQCMVVNPIYDKQTESETNNLMQSIVRQPHPNAEKTMCMITAPTSDPGTNMYTKPMTEILSNLSSNIQARFMNPTDTSHLNRPEILAYDMNAGFQTLASTTDKLQMCGDQNGPGDQRNKRHINRFLQNSY